MQHRPPTPEPDPATPQHRGPRESQLEEPSGLRRKFLDFCGEHPEEPECQLEAP